MIDSATRPAVVRESILPSLFVLASVLIASMPWGLAGNATFILPSCTVAVIFILSAGERPLVPVWAVFAAGLVSDFLTAGPLGYWAIIHLLTYSCARMVSPQTRHWQWIVLWICFIVTIALVGVTGWGLASLYFLRPIDWHPMLNGAIAAAIAFPAILWVLTRLFGLGHRRERAIWSEPL